MLSRTIPLLGVLAGLAGVAGVLRPSALTVDPAASAAPSDSYRSPAAPLADSMSQIENGLTSSNRSITSRMSAHQITGLSLVIVENNRTKFKRGYGLRIAGNSSSTVSTTTTFDAASVSKPVAAAAALQLVDQRRVSLTDTRILSAIAQKYIPAYLRAPFLLQFANANDIDLARLLSHCAGVLSSQQVNRLTSTSAQSFSLSSALPSIGQQLLGSSPASSNFKPVQTSALRPGVRYQYGGASYLLVEAVIDLFASNRFSGHTTALFQDLAMNSSTFADYKLPATVSAFRSTNHFARGHSNGSTLAARNYANHAAASLITTTEDLAKFLIMVNKDGVFNGKRILSATAVRALTGESGNPRCANRTIGGSTVMGLGMRSNSSGTRYHRGTHGGYRAYIFARPADQWAMAVLMTGNGSDADNFAGELLRAVERVYGFPSGSLPR